MTSYLAKRLPSHSGPAAWNAILGPQTPARRLEASVNCDFVIIGGGFAGLSAARRLRQLDSKTKIVVIDAGRVSEGAAGRNSGFMIDLPHELTSHDYAGKKYGADQATTSLNRKAISFAREAVNEYQIDPVFFDEAGKINGAGSIAADMQNRSYGEHLVAMGEDHEYLDASSMAAITGSRYYMSGLYTPGTVMLQPAGYIRGLAAGLSSSIDIFENSPAIEIVRSGTNWVVKTPKGEVCANKVILANNGHLESFGFKRGRLMHIMLFAMMSPELSKDDMKSIGGEPRWGITPSDPIGTTIRRIDTPLGGNRIITRSCAVFRPKMESKSADMKRAEVSMGQKFSARFPSLAYPKSEYCWSGHICLSPNAVSITRELDNGVFAACCQNGLGTARGTLTGIAVAELASGTTSTISKYFSAEPEPTRLPPEPFATAGATAYLRWKEWRARNE